MLKRHLAKSFTIDFLYAKNEKFKRFDLDYYDRVSYVAQLCAGGFSIIIFGFWSLQIQHPLIGIKTFAIIAAAVFVALIPTFKSTKYALFQPTSSSS